MYKNFQIFLYLLEKKFNTFKNILESRTIFPYSPIRRHLQKTEMFVGIFHKRKEIEIAKTTKNFGNQLQNNEKNKGKVGK